MNFALRAAWGETNSKIHIGPVHFWCFLMCSSPFPLVCCSPPSSNVPCHQAVFLPITPLNLLCEENMTPPLPFPTPSAPLSCSVFLIPLTSLGCTTHFICLHDMFVIWLTHWNVRSLRVRIFVYFCPYLSSNWNSAGKGPNQMPA